MDHAGAAATFARVAALRLVVDAIETVRLERNVVEPAAAMWAAAHSRKGGMRAATAMMAATIDELRQNYATQLAEAVLAATLIDARNYAPSVLDDIAEELRIAIDDAQTQVAAALGTVARAKQAQGDKHTKDPCPECGRPMTRYKMKVHRRTQHGVL